MLEYQRRHTTKRLFPTLSRGRLWATSGGITVNVWKGPGDKGSNKIFVNLQLAWFAQKKTNKKKKTKKKKKQKTHHHQQKT